MLLDALRNGHLRSHVDQLGLGYALRLLRNNTLLGLISGQLEGSDKGLGDCDGRFREGREGVLHGVELGKIFDLEVHSLATDEARSP